MYYDVSMTTFVDFSTKPGRARITEVKKYLQHREEDYDPSKDYWRPLRKLLQDHHSTGLTPALLMAEFKRRITDPKKQKNYKKAIRAYLKFLGNREVDWFEPLHTRWKHGNLAVRINPELGLRIDGVSHVIKLYLKNDTLNESRLASTLALLQDSLSAKVEPGTVIGVLNAGTGKLYSSSADLAIDRALLRADAETFLRICEAQAAA